MPKIILGTFIAWLLLNGRLGKFIEFAKTAAPATPPKKTETPAP